MPTNPIIPKTNSVIGSIVGPSAGVLAAGEISSNKFTGKLYIKKEDGTVALVNADATDITAGTLSASRLPAFSGDITTTVGFAVATVEKIRGKNVSTTAPTNGQALVWNNTNQQYEPTTIPANVLGGDLTGTIADAKVAKLNNIPINTAGIYNGSYLYYNGSSIIPSDVKASTVTNDNGSYSFRNRLINGDFRVDQRNLGAAITLNSTAVFVVDRWAVQTVGTALGTTTAQQISTFPTETGQATGNGYALKFLRTATGAGGNAWRISQAIESINCLDLAGKFVQLRMNYKSVGLTGATMNLKIVGGTVADEGLSLAIAGTLTGYTVIGETTGVSSASQGLLESAYASGTVPTNIKFIAVIITTNDSATLNSSFEITNVQLEAALSITPFEVRPIQVERALCQRYFQRISDIYVEGYLGALTRLSVPFPLSVAMRVTPARSVVTAGTRTNIRSDSTTYCGLNPRSATMVTAFVEASSSGFTSVAGQVEALNAEL